MKRIHPLFLLSLGGFFFAVDRFLKHQILLNPDHPRYLWSPWIGWEYFANSGVAFGIPLPWFAALVYTPLILALLLWYYTKKKSRDPRLQLGVVLIVVGALSNLIDRILYHITIDYIRIFTSIINLADVCIVGGVLLLLWTDRKVFPRA